MAASVKEAIVEGAKLCLNSEASNQSTFITYSTLLEVQLELLRDLHAKERIGVLSVLRDTLVGETTGDQKKDEILIERCGWDLVNVLPPILTAKEDVAAFTSGERSASWIIVEDILDRIVNRCSPKEIYMVAMERLSMLQWPEGSNLIKAETAVQFCCLLRLLTQTIPKINAKAPAKFLREPIFQIYTAIAAIETGHLGKRKRDSRTDEIATRLVVQSLDFVKQNLASVGKPTDLDLKRPISDPKGEARWLLLQCLTNIFEHTIATLKLHFLTQYEIRNHSRHIVPGSSNYMTEDAKLWKVWQNAINDAMSTFASFSTPNETLLEAARQSNGTEGDEEDFAGDELSEIGIVTIIAFQLASHTSPDTYPLSASLDSHQFSNLSSLYRTIITAKNGLLSQPSTIAEKALFVCAYLVDNIKVPVVMDELFKVQGQGSDSEHQVSSADIDPNSPCLMGFIQACICPCRTTTTNFYAQSVVIFSATQEDATLRFQAFSVLRRFLYHCDEPARLFILQQLLETCPMISVRAETLNLLKEQVANALSNQAESPFASAAMLQVFGPLIFSQPVKSTHGSIDVTEFWESFDFNMHALNFLLLLIMQGSSKDDKTGIWTNLNSLIYDFIAALESGLPQIREHVEEQQNTADENASGDDDQDNHDLPVLPYLTAQDKDMMHDRQVLNLEMMQCVLDRIHQVIEKKR
ncbi:hypothetical protein BZG36_03188 [Bifiguratus adelaidae]|uniref:Uncharacterized protein n=1 Tax=Bifiguratus adelaidae TaxID=1938954 RepID=A0A261XYI2_9FUNG|nr:hypothetical protein BZG36_03188 [Bifiguratus adelaidae]